MLVFFSFDANIPVARSGKKKRNVFLAKIQSTKHDTRENYVDTRGKRVTKKKKLEENKEKEVASPICHERMELSTKKGGNKDPHIIKRFSSTGQLESGTCNYCNSIPSNHYCRAKVKGSGIKISGSNEEICGKLSCMVCRSELESSPPSHTFPPTLTTSSSAAAPALIEKTPPTSAKSRSFPTTSKNCGGDSPPSI